MKPPSAHEWFGLVFLGLVVGLISLAYEYWDLTKYLIVFLGGYWLFRLWWYGDAMEERRVKAETWKLYRSVSKQLQKLEKEHERGDDETDDRVLFGQAIFGRLPEDTPDELQDAFVQALLELYDWEDFDIVGVSEPPAICNSIEGGKYRDALNSLSLFLQRHGSIRNIAIKRISESFTEFLAHFDFQHPETEDVLAYAPIEQMAGSNAAVESLVLSYFSHDAIDAGVFTHLQKKLNQNLCAVSGIEYTEQNAESEELILPSEYEGDNLAWDYFHDTPLMQVARSKIPFSIPRHIRYEHTMIVGGSGHGKTTLLQHMILNDLVHAKRGDAGFAVIDPKGSLIDAISRLECFAPDTGELADKIIIVDPRRDAEYPPAINMFDLGVDDIEDLTLADKLAVRNNALEMIEYMFSELLKVEMTGRQEVAFNYVGDLMMNIEGATIETLLEFLNQPQAFLDDIAKCDHTTRAYLENQFITDRFKSVRDQLSDRVYGVLKLPMMEAMFSHEKTEVDVAEAVNEGKIVLINANENFLSTNGSSIFGSVWIGLLFQACLSRVTIPEYERKGFTLYIDEASMFFSEKLRQMLIKAREFKLGVVFAFQDLEQIESPQLRSSAMGSTSTKFVGGLNARDRRAFANEMNTTEMFLRRPTKDQKALQTEFACYVRGEMSSPVILSFPIGKMSQEPAMTDAEFENLVEQNRRNVSDVFDQQAEEVPEMGANGAEQEEKPEKSEPPTHTSFDDDFTVDDDD